MEKCKSIPVMTEKQINRFWAKVYLKANKYLCWVWNGRKDDCGYGRFTIRHDVFSAHRIAYNLINEVDLTDLHVLHTCDNPTCCNPNHLFTGNHTINMRDRERKGRANHPSGDKHGTKTQPQSLATGERNGHFTHPEATLKGSNKPNSKFTEDQIIEVRKLCNDKSVSYAFISKKYNVSIPTIEYIVKGKTWKHVPIKEIQKRDKGEESPLSKLTNIQVIYMRNLYSEGNTSYSELAKMFSMSRSQIAVIIRGESWRHLLPNELIIPKINYTFGYINV
jgi:Mor family transcriptional regulator